MIVCVIANASAMAGAEVAGGLGDVEIRYGYERYETCMILK